MSQVAFFESLVIEADPRTRREDSREAQGPRATCPEALPQGNQTHIRCSSTNELLRPLLLVDDDSDFHVLFEASLRAAGICEPLVVLEEGRSVVPWLERQMQLGSRRPLLLLLDVHLPDRGGFDVLRELKQNARFHTTPVVLLTGDQRSEVLSQALDLGASSAVTKPTNFAALVDLVRSFARYYGILTNGSSRAREHGGAEAGGNGSGAARGWIKRR